MSDASKLRDLILEYLAGSWWVQDACEIIGELRDWEGIGEELRAIVSRKIGKPPSPHMVGAAVRAAWAKGYIEPTGKYRAPLNLPSHARKTQVWRTCG